MGQHGPFGCAILENWNAGPRYVVCKGGGDVHRDRKLGGGSKSSASRPKS